MADATMVERLTRALDRAEVTAADLRAARDREATRADAALAAGDGAVAALDALLAGPR